MCLPHVNTKSKSCQSHQTEFFSVFSTLNVLSCVRGGSVYPLRLTSDSDSDSDVGPIRALSESHRCTAIQRLITVLSLIFVPACHSTGLMERISALIALQNERKKIVINQNYIFLICKVHFKKISYVVLSRNPVGIGPTVSKRTLYVLVFYMYTVYYNTNRTDKNEKYLIFSPNHSESWCEKLQVHLLCRAVQM